VSTLCLEDLQLREGYWVIADSETMTPACNMRRRPTCRFVSLNVPEASVATDTRFSSAQVETTEAWTFVSGPLALVATGLLYYSFNASGRLMAMTFLQSPSRPCGPMSI
jgi:hypothetical protein